MADMLAAPFLAALALKALLTAGFVVGALAAAEAAGPFWGGVLASLPVSAGPTYVLLARHHGAGFIAASALESLAANTATWAFLLVLIRLAPRARWPLALGAGLAAWLACSLALGSIAWTTGRAVALNVAAFAGALALTRDWAGPGAPGRAAAARRWYDLPLRGAMVATLTTAIVTLSHVLGPRVTGIAAVFPIMFTSLSLLALTRMGGAATASMLAAGLRAQPGFALCMLTVALTAARVGVWPAMGLGLAVSVAWTLGLIVRRRRAPVAA
ncbi:MAG: hypothetical protein KGI51_06090 [Rhodospirillales bacterium]|nr:hypothetical protein [Rhodospirillales bacterium]